LKKLIDELPEAIAGELLDFVEYLRAKQARCHEAKTLAAGLNDEDKAWPDTDSSRLGEIEPYEWGDANPLAGEPVRWDQQAGAFVVERQS
jgi:hypothetical protein